MINGVDKVTGPGTGHSRKRVIILGGGFGGAYPRAHSAARLGHVPMSS